jgi:hypothetical protein
MRITSVTRSRKVEVDAFDFALTRRAVDEAILLLTDAYSAAYPRHGVEWEEAIRHQIFDCTPNDQPLFRLFCTNAANRNGGAPVRDWQQLASLFTNWDAGVFANRYPTLADGALHSDLRDALLTRMRPAASSVGTSSTIAIGSPPADPTTGGFGCCVRPSTEQLYLPTRT